MKKQAFVLVLILLCTSFSITRSQITITHSDFPSSQVQQMEYFEGWNSFSFDVVSTGPGHVWDFSQADTLTGAILSEEFLDPSLSPIPGTNILSRKTLEFMPGIYDYKETHAHVSPSDFFFRAFRLYNNYSSDSTIISMEPGLRFMALPAEYNDSWTEYHKMVTTNNGTIISSDSVRGIFSIDGWGQVITPYGNFDCLRMLAQWSYYDQGMNIWDPLDTTLVWMTNNIPMVIVIEQYTTNNQTGLHEGWFRIFKSKTMGIGPFVPDIGITGLIVSPNPAENDMNISFKSSAALTIHVSLFTVAGQKELDLFDGVIAPGTFSHSFVLPSMASGLYLLEILTDQGTLRRKVVIE